MKLTLKQLSKRAGDVDKVVIESVDLSLYLARAYIAGEAFMLADNRGGLLKTHNLLAMKRQLKAIVDCELFLRQQSAYDEMVGHGYAAQSNTMEISLGREPLPDWLQ